jgi:hypothetical protein
MIECGRSGRGTLAMGTDEALRSWHYQLCSQLSYWRRQFIPRMPLEMARVRVNERRPSIWLLGVRLPPCRVVSAFAYLLGLL